MLDKERAFWSTQAQAWATAFPGRFLVVKNEELVGDYATIEEALAAGASRYGMQPFLVRRAGVPAEVVSVPALTLGLLRANT